MLILILVKFNIYRMFSCEKGSNGQNHFSGSHHWIKKFLSKISHPPHLGEFNCPQPLNATWKAQSPSMIFQKSQSPVRGGWGLNQHIL